MNKNQQNLYLALLTATAFIATPVVAQDGASGSSSATAGSATAGSATAGSSSTGPSPAAASSPATTGLSTSIAGPDGRSGAQDDADTVGGVEPLGGPLPVIGETDQATQDGPIAPTPIEDGLADRQEQDDASILVDDASIGVAGRDESRQQLLGDDAGDPFGFGIVATLGLKVSGSLTTEYTDNVRRARRAGVDGNGSDWRFKPDLRLSGGHRLGPHMLFFESAVGRDYYARNTWLDRSRFRGSGGVQWVLGSRCGGRFQADYSVRATEYNDFEDVVSSRRKRTTLMAAATCQTSSGLKASLDYGYMKAKNNLQSRSYADVYSHSVNAGLGYAFSYRGDVGVRFGWIDATNPNQDFGPFGVGGTRIRSVSSYASYRLGSSLTVNGGLGYTKAKPRVDFGQGFSGVTWNAGLQYRVNRISLRGTAARSVSSGRGGQSNLTVSRSYGLNAGYNAGDRLSFNAGYQHSKSGYRGTGIIADPSGVRGYNSDNWHAGANYRLNRLVTTSLNYRHRKRTSNLSDYGYSTNTVGLTVRVGL